MSSLAFDANHVTGSGVTYDPDGNTIDDSVHAHIYDAENHLIAKKISLRTRAIISTMRRAVAFAGPIGWKSTPATRSRKCRCPAAQPKRANFSIQASVGISSRMPG